MINILLSRWRQGHRTLDYPRVEPILSDRFIGCIKINKLKCASGCNICINGCPTGAIQITCNDDIEVDLGKCLFCTNCMRLCRSGAISFTKDYRLAVSSRKDLLLSSDKEFKLAIALNKELLSILGRSLKLRVVSAGGCNGCEVDTNVLETVVWDIGRFGIQYVASPRHADGMLLCGPITSNMFVAVRKTYDAIPNPKLVIAIGACAISGGPYLYQDEQLGGITGIDIPVDLFVPGCPPHPLSILDGLLRLLNRI